MKIIKLTAENVKRLKAVEITPEGNLVIVGGLNDQGKSSTLDSIAMAFGGKKYIPAMPVRKGEKKARIVAETEDLIVTRTMTEEGGGTLKVSSKDGKYYQSPQAILDALTGQLTFDPLAFSRMKPEKQLETLKQLVGLDFTNFETNRNALYVERTDINREEKQLVGALDSMSSYDDAPAKEVSVAELMEELEKRRVHNRKIETEKRTLNDYERNTALENKKIEEIGEQIKDLQARISGLQKRKYELKLSIASHYEIEAVKRKEIGTMIEADTQEIIDQISSAENINQQVRANREIAKVTQQVEELRIKSQTITDKINAIDTEKEKQLSEAKFPIAGLSFDENGVLYNGIPFDQLSSSKKLEISVSMGFTMNPELRVLLIKDGPFLDEGNLKLLAEMAEKEDAQVWIERVGEGQEVSVIIEDGSIKSQ
jgi:hypothetical protein